MRGPKLHKLNRRAYKHLNTIEHLHSQHIQSRPMRGPTLHRLNLPAFKIIMYKLSELYTESPHRLLYQTNSVILAELYQWKFHTRNVIILVATLMRVIFLCWTKYTVAKAQISNRNPRCFKRSSDSLI